MCKIKILGFFFDGILISLPFDLIGSLRDIRGNKLNAHRKFKISIITFSHIILIEDLDDI